MSNPAAPCMSRFTTAKGEHWCSVEVATEHASQAYAAGSQVAHNGPCVEITARWGAVENTIWAAMKSNAHLIRPKSELDEVHAEALAIHLAREASQHRVLIVTGGELHDWAAAPKADMTLNLSRLLRDPAHLPSGEMLALRGDVDQVVQDFVLATTGAVDLLNDWNITVVNSAERTPLVVYVLCRGGKHRAAAFGTLLQRELGAWGVNAVVHHLHAHLDRVIIGE